MQNQQAAQLQLSLKEAERALAGQDFDTCIRICDEVLRTDAINLHAHLFRGVASGQVGQFARAIQDLRYVLERRPEQPQALFFLGQALQRSQQYEPALKPLKSLVENPAFRIRALFELALCLNGLGRRRQAIKYYRALLAEEPRHADAAINLAVLLEQASDLEEAVNWAKRALILAPGDASAKLVLARVHRRQKNYPEAVKLLESLLQSDLSSTNRTIAHNQLARCLESQGAYDAAFEHYAEANRIQQEHNPEAAVDDYGSYGIELVRHLRLWLRDHPLSTWSATPVDERDAPVFLLGFPRSGTTLLDQVLSAHPRIEVLEERELLLEVRRTWISAERFDRLHLMTGDEINEARKVYRGALAAARQRPEASLVVDKLPLNSMYIQLIYRLFPEARILIARRDPRDVCLSCYFQVFELVGAMPYFLDLERTAEYYVEVRSLLDEAEAVLPLKSHTVRYEDLVTDFESRVRGILDFLKVPWDDQILGYRERSRERSILTPSYQQVSEPVHSRSIGKWKHYQKQIQPITGALKPWTDGQAAPQNGEPEPPGEPTA